MRLLSEIRKILLEQYIGAITIAFVFVNGISELAGALLKPVTWYVNTPSPYRSVLGGVSDQTNPFHWEWMLVPLVGAVLQFGAGYGLLKWLYLHKQETADTSEIGDDLTRDEASADGDALKEVTVLHEPE